MTANNLTLAQKRFVAIDVVGKGSESAATLPSVVFAGTATYDEYGNPGTRTATLFVAAM